MPTETQTTEPTQDPAAPHEAVLLGSADADAADPVASGEMQASHDAERERIERQLEQLKRKEAELRRALVVADHPELGESIDEVGGRLYAVQTAARRLEAPLSKSEQKKVQRLEKKHASLSAKRAELDASIGELEQELAQLGEARLELLEAEREEALRILLRVLSEHASAFDGAGLQVSELLPELEPWLPSLRAMTDAVES